MDRTHRAQYHFFPWVIWGLAASVFVTEYIVRVAPSAMVPELMHALTADATDISSLSFYVLLPYVLMQIPVGLLIERFGSRLMLSLATLLCAYSTYLFSITTTLWVAQLSRFMFGFGAAFAFVGALKLASNWFSQERFSILVGATQGLGMLGAAAGSAFVGRILLSYSYQECMHSFAIILLGIAILLALFVRNAPPSIHSLKKATLSPKFSVWAALKTVITSKQTWLASACAGFLYVPTGVFGELWGSFYLQNAHGFSATNANDALSLIFIGWALGGPLAGWLANLIGRRQVIMLCGLCGMLLMPLILYCPGLPVPVMYTLIFVFGVTNSGTVGAYTMVAESHPQEINGVALGFANAMSVIVAMVCQPVVGFTLDWFRNTRGAVELNDYLPYELKIAFSLIILGSALGLLTAYFTKETLEH